MKPTMLVVDDEPLVRMDLVALAREGGFGPSRRAPLTMR